MAWMKELHQTHGHEKANGTVMELCLTKEDEGISSGGVIKEEEGFMVEEVLAEKTNIPLNNSDMEVKKKLTRL
ncbi:hypothetical protein HPP92_020398 [Vanilla planifolia]|uniref:Uncharacterized protein n=1 Tax=Vanilla planifolia TaxID=51239 RepID=A0A835Q5W6_VANPL|nr:hypothetical protein HPP92_020398 [Vanilla planifolia]